MGIGRDLDDSRPLKVVTFSDAEGDLSENDLVENLIEQNDTVNIRLKKRYRRKSRNFEVSITQKLPKSSSSSKKKKRYNETVEMINATIDDLCWDCSDIMNETNTPFRRLLSNPKDMKKWRKFVEVDRLEQNSMTENNDFLVLDMSLLSLEDDRESYNKINEIFDGLLPSQRTLLFKNENILTEMESLEQELRTFFQSSACECSVYLYKSEAERITCNVVSQYLGLSYESYKENKKMITEVSNSENKFVCPKLTMSGVLSETDTFSAKHNNNKEKKKEEKEEKSEKTN